MVKISNLTKSYKSLKVLNGLNMNIEKGDVYGFIGRNGSGKTTTMNIICNILPKDGGEISVGGSGKTVIGYLPESPSLFGYMNAEEYLNYIAACCEFNGDVKNRTKYVLDVVGLSKSYKRRIKGYSRGMNQRLGIGAAIYNNPDLLILDEPTSALDPQGRAEVVSIIERLKEIGATIILSTHILPDVERVADKVGILHDGVIIEEGFIKDIKHSNISDKISVIPAVLGEETEKIFRSAPFAICNYSEKTQSFIFEQPTDDTYGATNSVQDIKELSVRLMSYLSENNTAVMKIEILQPTLEDIYMKVVRENSHAN